MTTVQSLWQDFDTKVVAPSGAGDVQRSEMRKAFFAGANVMFYMMVEASGYPEDTALTVVEKISKELRDFPKTLKEKA